MLQSLDLINFKFSVLHYSLRREAEKWISIFPTSNTT